MAVSMLLLGPDDRLAATDWVRPLAPAAGEFPASEMVFNSFSCYGGTPQNHFKWVRAADVIGDCWMGKTLKDIDSAWTRIGGFAYEVIRGDLPSAHVWDWRSDKKKRQ